MDHGETQETTAREAMARAIDPDAWKTWPGELSAGEEFRRGRKQAEALGKADRVTAALGVTAEDLNLLFRKEGIVTLKGGVSELDNPQGREVPWRDEHVAQGPQRIPETAS